MKAEKKSPSKAQVASAEQPLHTQGEWKQHPIHSACITDDNGVMLLQPSKGNQKMVQELVANAKRIAKAVNILSKLEKYTANTPYKVNPKQDAVLEYINELLK